MLGNRYSTYTKFLVNIFYREVSLPKYLSGMSSGIRTSNKRSQLAGKYMNESSIATAYVNVVTIIRLPDLLLIKAGTVLSTNSGCRLA